MSGTLISSRELRRRAGNRSAMWVYRHERSDPDFPTPYRFAPKGPKFWREGEVEHYIESRREPRRRQTVTSTIEPAEPLDAPLEGNPAAHEQVAGTATRQALCTGDAAKSNRKWRGDRGSGDSDNAP